MAGTARFYLGELYGIHVIITQIEVERVFLCVIK